MVWQTRVEKKQKYDKTEKIGESKEENKKMKIN